MYNHHLYDDEKLEPIYPRGFSCLLRLQNPNAICLGVRVGILLAKLSLINDDRKAKPSYENNQVLLKNYMVQIRT